MPIDLPNAVEGHVVTRFPPEPSWYLDIGHCKAALMNQFIAQQFKGQWILRFDDTNPRTCSASCVSSYLEDLPLLGLTPSRITHASDYFDLMMEDVVQLIGRGFLYADETPVDQMRDQRLMKQFSSSRDLPPTASLAAWNEMQQGSDEGCRFCLRFRLQPDSENGALRDPVAYRVIRDPPHCKTGARFKSYPTYDFSAPWLDAAEGVTHALRTLEFRDRDVLYQAVQEQVLRLHPAWKPATIWEFPRIHMAFTPQAKVHQRALLSAGVVAGPHDPRLPTLRGLMRAGCHPRALRDFLLEQVTPARKETYHSWDKLWTLNRRLLDPTASRHMAVLDQGRVMLTVQGGPERPEPVTVQWKQGHVVHVVRYKTVWIDQDDAALLEQGDEVTLLAWGTVKITAVHRREAAAAVIERAANGQQVLPQQQQQQHACQSVVIRDEKGDVGSTITAAVVKSPEWRDNSSSSMTRCNMAVSGNGPAAAAAADAAQSEPLSPDDFADVLALRDKLLLSRRQGQAGQQYSFSSSVCSTAGSTNPPASITLMEQDTAAARQDEQQLGSTLEETHAGTPSVSTTATAAAAAATGNSSTSSSGCGTHMTGTFIPTGNPKDSKLKIHWLPALPDDGLLLPLKLVSYRHPVKVERVVDEVDVVKHFNQHSRQECLAWGDPSLMQSIRPGAVVQLQRKGLYIVDQVVLNKTAAMSIEGLAHTAAACLPAGVQVSVPTGAERFATAVSPAAAALAVPTHSLLAAASDGAAGQGSQVCAADVHQVIMIAIPDGHTKHAAHTQQSATSQPV